MSEWTDLIKKLIKENPGTPLKTIIPMATKIYKKPEGKPIGKPMNFTSKRGKRGRKGTRRQKK
jgi:hypothetical protein